MSAEVSGLAANMRLQRQLWLFAHIAVILTAATITVGPAAHFRELGVRRRRDADARSPEAVMSEPLREVAFFECGEAKATAKADAVGLCAYTR
jgi:hypothetical protein